MQDSATLVLGGDPNKKRKLLEKKKTMKKSASFNSGSELFDALLMAAADDGEAGDGGEVSNLPMSTLPLASSTQKMRSERKKRGSFNNFFDSFDQDSERKPETSEKKKPFMRRNSVSMILNNPVLAQTGAGDRYCVRLPSHVCLFACLPSHVRLPHDRPTRHTLQLAAHARQ